MMNLPSVMKHQFSEVPRANIQRSRFDRSHGYKTTFNSGLLVPVFLDEIIPGDTFTLDTTLFARLATPIHPTMDNAYLDLHFFFVPNRLVWDNWERFNGAQTDPGDSTDYLIPEIESKVDGYDEMSIYDYFGLPTDTPGQTYTHSALPLRAYNLIYNEWYRDQNLIDSLPVPRGDGPDLYTNYTLQRRGKRHDYFTSALPWPQKGPSVSIPLGDTAPVSLTNSMVTTTNAALTNLTVESNAPTHILDQYPIRTLLGVAGGYKSNPIFNADDGSGGAAGTDFNMRLVSGNVVASSFVNSTQWDAANPVADLSDATAATVNALREAITVQHLFERDARGGTRYTEILLSHFGVTSPDFRLQRPEYLGGGSRQVNINPVANTTGTVDAAQGDLAGYGTLGANGIGFNKSFVEHGFVIGLISVRADLTYQQGLDRLWSRSTRYDHYWPVFANLGEQEVLSKEIYCDGTSADDDIFGYQERFAEYRYKPSRITGLFRSSAAQSLDSWHYSQDFETRPTLSQLFIQETPPISRTIKIPSQPEFILDSYFKLRCARPMPVRSVPGLNQL